MLYSQNSSSGGSVSWLVGTWSHIPKGFRFAPHSGSVSEAGVHNYNSGENANGTDTLKNRLAVFYKVKHTIIGNFLRET